ncbi:MAG: lipid-A-disaccharide synthase-related protein [Cyanobacteriota bacterium]|nr:lipid-A-disaccharide synthase-related protein [Cyanobacteriota bacterium]
MAHRLLVLSNGHGEDLIALRLIQALLERRPGLEIAVLPLVGEGGTLAAEEAAGRLRRVGPRRELPSGGFSNQSLRGMLSDLAAGVLGLSWRQWQLVQHWGRGGDPVLAVGDLLPLLMAWAAGGPYGFIGTPKSDFTWISPAPADWPTSPWDRLADAYHRCKSSEWDPWEWALMGQRRCRLVAVRDRLTARGLRRRGVAALAPGNPMMDGFSSPTPPPWLSAAAAGPLVLLLPGSRMPEALANTRRLVDALTALAKQQPGPLTALLVTGSRPSPAELTPLLQAAGFGQGFHTAAAAADPEAIGAAACWRRGEQQLLLGPGQFSRWAPWASAGLATAGTATEQLVGLGIPALSIPGPGPQFKAGFARRQSRLLGGSVLPCRTPLQAAARLAELLQHPRLRRRLGAVGRARMGPAGGSARLAALVEQRLLE